MNGNLAPAAVGTGKISDRAVTTDKLASGAITTAKIKGKAVTVRKLSGNSVSTGKIQPGAVTTGKIKDYALDGSKLTGTYSIPGLAFVPAEDGGAHRSGNYEVNRGNGGLKFSNYESYGRFWAPVNLPPGTRIRRLYLQGWDMDPTSVMELTLSRYCYTCEGGGPPFPRTVLSGIRSDNGGAETAPGVFSFSKDLNHEVWSGPDYTYVLEIQLNRGSLLEFGRASIDYGY